MTERSMPRERPIASSQYSTSLSILSYGLRARADESSSKTLEKLFCVLGSDLRLPGGRVRACRAEFNICDSTVAPEGSPATTLDRILRLRTPTTNRTVRRQLP